MRETGGAGPRRLCAVSVDLDEIPYYHQIHGLAAPAPAAADRVFDLAVPRLDELARRLGVPLTYFVIGQTARRPENAAKLRELVDRGNEVGNHTFGHRYDLTRLGRARMRAEVEDAQDAIERAVGSRPVGFRAPGYTTNDELFELLRDLGFRYDSSVFPCPLYWGAKGIAMGAIRLRGRRSSSVLDTPKVLLAPTRPYRVGRPYWVKGEGMWELPIQVTRALRLPFIGTALTLAGPKLARVLVRGVLGEPFVNLELHGVDALDGEDGLGDLARHQPDLGVPAQRKLEILEAVVGALKGAGYELVTLARAASELEDDRSGSMVHSP